MSLMYRLKVRLLKTPRGNLWWRNRQIKKGMYVGNYNELPKYIRQYVPGKSFVVIEWRLKKALRWPGNERALA